MVSNTQRNIIKKSARIIVLSLYFLIALPRSPMPFNLPCRNFTSMCRTDRIIHFSGQFSIRPNSWSSSSSSFPHPFSSFALLLCSTWLLWIRPRFVYSRFFVGINSQLFLNKLHRFVSLYFIFTSLLSNEKQIHQMHVIVIRKCWPHSSFRCTVGRFALYQPPRGQKPTRSTDSHLHA